MGEWGDVFRESPGAAKPKRFHSFLNTYSPTLPLSRVYRDFEIRDNGKENGNYYSILGLYWVYSPLK